MAKQITEYCLLISCPSDVQEELKIINETVDTFNRSLGAVNNARILTKHWSKDSFPQSGGKPQKLLNKQFVLSCDVAAAVFWTRFGTPTDKYGSGTEEEIEELLKSDKQVFLYFSDCPVNPSQVDDEQYEKVKAFKVKYKNHGLYWTYSNLDTFKKDFLNHLTLYFVNLLDDSQVQVQKTHRSNLSLKGVFKGKLVDKAFAYRTQYSNSKYLDNLRGKALLLVNQINDINLPQATASYEAEKIISENNQKEEFPDVTTGELMKLPKPDLVKLSDHFVGLKELFPLYPVTVSDTYKQNIEKFSKDNGIQVNDSFYYLGELSTHKNNFAFFSGSSNSYNGTDDEKNKYKLICELGEIVTEYYESQKYFSTIDSKIFINLALCNLGTDYDEDIDVKLYIKKGYICYSKNLPFPDYKSLEMGIEAFEHIYEPKKTVDIDLYPDYNIEKHIPRVQDFPILGVKSFEEELEEKTEAFNDKIKKVFCYDLFSDNEHDILCYNQKYLKQNTNSFLPSYLILNKTPDKIKYEITSKRYPEIIKNELPIEDVHKKNG